MLRTFPPAQGDINSGGDGAETLSESDAYSHWTGYAIMTNYIIGAHMLCAVVFARG